MKKIIVSAAVAAMALSTSAFALEDVKTTGQMKVWYETDNAASETKGDMFSTSQSSAEVVFKLGFTGKQGDVGFGATLYQTSTMGLEGKIVGATRTNAANKAPFVGEAYITAPIAPSTTLKFGKQELDTPLAFTERWNALPNTFNAAVAINSSIDNVTLIAAYVGQDNSTNWKVDGNVNQQYFGGATTIAALYANSGLNVNFWAYHIENVGGATAADATTGTLENRGGVSVNAAWLDASMKIADVATVKAYAALVSNDGDDSKDTSAFALSGAGKAGPVSLFAAASYVSDGDLAVANTATGFKKTKLPTAGVYTDGLYVAQPGSTAVKVKASGKLGSTGIALQAVMNMNDEARFEDAAKDNKKEATEIDLIVTQKVGVFNLKGILMNRSFGADSMEDAQGGQHVRVIASVNF